MGHPNPPSGRKARAVDDERDDGVKGALPSEVTWRLPFEELEGQRRIGPGDGGLEVACENLGDERVDEGELLVKLTTHLGRVLVDRVGGRTPLVGGVGLDHGLDVSHQREFEDVERGVHLHEARVRSADERRGDEGGGTVMHVESFLRFERQRRLPERFQASSVALTQPGLAAS
ncbi:MAG: hypothetical protein J0H83_18660 [Candidatus Melainabacteria bacterium]|nr:hypothetical protein [Candidatus Melainabacteria bacterium]